MEISFSFLVRGCSLPVTSFVFYVVLLQTAAAVVLPIFMGDI
jgi:hypothetical protein